MSTSKKITGFLIPWPGVGNAMLCSLLKSQKFSLPWHPGTVSRVSWPFLGNLGGVGVGHPGCAQGTCMAVWDTRSDAQGSLVLWLISILAISWWRIFLFIADHFLNFGLFFFLFVTEIDWINNLLITYSSLKFYSSALSKQEIFPLFIITCHFHFNPELINHKWAWSIHFPLSALPLSGICWHGSLKVIFEHSPTLFSEQMNSLLEKTL